METWLREHFLGVITLMLSMAACGAALMALREGRRSGRHVRAMLSQWQRDRIEEAGRVEQRSQAQREEISWTLRGLQETVLSLSGEISRNQKQQNESFEGQLRAMAAAEETRLERMRQNIEARLAQYDQQMQRVTELLDVKLASNEARIERLRGTLSESLVSLQEGNAKKLDEIRITVGEKLDSTLDKRLGESFKLVSERLEQVYKGLGEMQNLAQGVGDLKKVLSNVKTRGTWGEVQLGALLEQVLSPSQYERNAQIKQNSDERVDFAIRMPGKQEDAMVLLPIDAKFPMEDYRRLVEASEAGDLPKLEEASRALDAAIRTQAKRVQSKYIDPPRTTDFAILYLPVEGLYAEVLRRGEAVERLQREYRIVLAGPTTLLALLNSLQMGFRTLAIERRSSEVWALLGAVKTEFGRFIEVLSKTQRRLRLASESIEDATRRTQTIQRKLSDVQELSQEDSVQWIQEGTMLDQAEDLEESPSEDLV